AEANRVSEKSGHGAELAAVRAASSGFDGNNAKRSPAFPDLLEQGSRGLRHQIELVEVDCVPRDHGVLLQRRLALLAEGVHRRVNILKSTARSIRNNQRPGRIGFAQ